MYLALFDMNELIVKSTKLKDRTVVFRRLNQMLSFLITLFKWSLNTVCFMITLFYFIILFVIKND